MRVVDDEHQRLVPPGPVEDLEHPQSDQEFVRRWALLHAGGDAKRLLVSRGQCGHVARERRGGPLKGGVRHCALRLVAVAAEDSHTVQLTGDVPEQGGLADAGGATDRHRPTDPVAGTDDQRAEFAQLLSPSEQ